MTSNKIFNINLTPLDQNEFFANDKNNVYFTSSGGALVTNILLGTIKYDLNYIDPTSTNSISNFLNNSKIYNPSYDAVQITNPNKNIVMNEKVDYNNIGYLQDRHIKDKNNLLQTFNIIDISYITDYRNYTKSQSFSTSDPTYNVVQITLDTTNKKHFFSLYDGRNDPEGYDIFNPLQTQLTIQINNNDYKVFSIPVEIVYDTNGNDISEWVFYINDPGLVLFTSGSSG
jgi:hypothetical protein